jgi:hypothetical protein
MDNFINRFEEEISFFLMFGGAIVLILVLLGGMVLICNLGDNPSCKQLSTATVEASSDAPVPVGYPDDSEVV